MATRLQLQTNTIFFFGFMFITIPFSSSLPFIVIHGINDECSSEVVSHFTDLLNSFTSSEGYCIEVGNGKQDSWFKPIKEQAGIVCDKVKQMKVLSEGYNIVALSQGNIIGRTVLEFCEGGPPVKNFIALAGPHAGVAKVPLCDIGPISCKIADEILKFTVYSDAAQDHVGPSGYVKIPTEIPKYLKGCKLLPYLNNEIPNQRNSTLKKRFTSLQNLVLIMFQNDTVLIPKETSWFGYYPDGSLDRVLPHQETKLYTEDWIGLRTLDEAGKVKFISVPGEHVQISESDMKKYVIPYLEDEPSDKTISKKWSSSIWTAVGELTGLAQE